MTKKRNTLNLPPAADAPSPRRGAARPAGEEREWVTTSVRFKRHVLRRLKRAALDRDQSFQEMVEEALYRLLKAEGVVVAGLRGGDG